MSVVCGAIYLLQDFTGVEFNCNISRSISSLKLKIKIMNLNKAISPFSKFLKGSDW
jgi:hypothetical protein